LDCFIFYPVIPLLTIAVASAKKNLTKDNYAIRAVIITAVEVVLAGSVPLAIETLGSDGFLGRFGLYFIVIKNYNFFSKWSVH
jgi:hypothetical protein